MSQDKTLTCVDCGREFVFTAAEQDFYAQKGFTNEPKRCPDCRAAKKNSMGRNRGPRQMYETVCSNCGGKATVPFEPKGDKPVLCDNCFRQMKGNR
ncbi:zinc-binding protein [candidate division WWE3 bacterium RIFCSPHIGHO2_01_FULL_40_23]|uniref:Zinc-binding protein n=1 Tax=candidate division WWE3 bacterium RIFCSPLOWO2_01_FULL_41_18 TaxID=1802625 RepID=A0A1F4VGS5_UNCKA|nr:MAG: zinc-binding protein [candidate division WWE3 bacterium RIFCSPHIGHO2_01_FULL_40_23]OGC55933.1 MAG: zinc-binding protein [candidate division WWE3 bacterium RIFCSPLOWO2_01_FULL_41_18]